MSPADNENKDDSDSSALEGNSSESADKKEEASSSTEVSVAEAPAAGDAEYNERAKKLADSVKSTSQLPARQGGREDRSNWVSNFNKTLEYIGKISADKSLHFRASDKITSRLLLGAFGLAITFAILPFFEMGAVAACSYILADILLFGAIGVFVVSRFGIIRAMEPRHALVCWHLMVGTGLLALVFAFNVVAAVVLIMLRDRLPMLFPGA